MRSVVGALMFLSGSVLVGAGIIAQSSGSRATGVGIAGYALGGFVWLVAVAVMISAIGDRLRIIRPVDEEE